jgi:cell division protein FtsW
LLYLAAWLESRKGNLRDVSSGIGPFIATLGAIALLMILQPDIGTLSIVGLTSLLVYFVGGGRKTHIIGIILFGILGFVIMVQLKPYQMNRFKCMFDPSFSKGEICYQVNQSLIAVGSGGLFGRGLGASRQKFMYLPEVSGDSIFAIIAEETGMLICSIFVLGFLFLFYRAYKIALHAHDDFGRILAIGIAGWLVFQALINIGGIINIMPMTGVPLPFVSYGGSAVLAALSACGILVNISKYTKL